MDLDDAGYAKTQQQLKKNSRLSQFLASMPQNVRESFTQEQLIHIQIALRTPAWKKHLIDLRSSIAFFSYHYYYAFVAGRDMRELSRQEIRIKRWSYLLFLSIFLILCTLLGLLVLYIVKSALGIDLFANFSLGIWTWLQINVLGT